MVRKEESVHDNTNLSYPKNVWKVKAQVFVRKREKKKEESENKRRAQGLHLTQAFAACKFRKGSHSL